MNKKDLLEALKIVKNNSPKRKFNQSYDLIINFKSLDLKKPEHQVDIFVQLPNERGKKVKVCALVGPELKDQAKKACDQVISLEEFDKYAKDKKLTKKVATDNDFFVAQANLMPKVAAAFGRVLGPKGKMPNPKAGCVVPPNANLPLLVSKLQHTVRVSVKTTPLFQCKVGNEETEDEKVVDNSLVIYNSLIHVLPNEHHNIKSMYLKFTMGPSVKVGGFKEEQEPTKQKEKQPKLEEPKKEESQEEIKEPKEEPKQKEKKPKKVNKEPVSKNKD